MRRFAKIACSTLLAIAVALAFCGCSASVSAGKGGSSSVSSSAVASSSAKASKTSSSASAGTSSAKVSDITVTENGEYSDKDHVALYIHKFGHLPSNYISKTKARKAGWVNTKGNLWDVLPGKSIGGSEYYNDDGKLPDKNGRRWTECDIDFDGGYRNSKRIVFSNDGLVFYTDDHYETFEQLY